jgi:hypothetical protein
MTDSAPSRSAVGLHVDRVGPMQHELCSTLPPRSPAFGREMAADASLQECKDGPASEIVLTRSTHAANPLLFFP